ncbi:NRT1/ PTR family 5.2-like protein [Tanacetum coccineum]
MLNTNNEDEGTRRRNTSTSTSTGGEVEEKGNGEGGGGYTEDGTVDLRGNPVLRSKRGGWKACSFIVG